MKALVLLIVLASTPLALGCTPRDRQPVEQRPEPDAWVVVSYDAKPSDPAMMELLETELAAERALRKSGAGVIDGNEVARGVYELYFVGRDREELWRILKPILAKAPVQWSRVELRRGLRDKDPQVLLR